MSLPYLLPARCLRFRLRLAMIVAASVAALFASTSAGAQAAAPQQLVFAGLRSVAAQGRFTSVEADASGNLFLLLDQGDGVRLLKCDPAAQTILAQAQLGAHGDHGVAMALDPAGNVYVTGTTTSSALLATAGAAFGSRTDLSTNSFVARFDTHLSPVFVTFTGGSRIAASAIAVTADAVFVTGITFSDNLPVTPQGVLQSPAVGSLQNGFAERFSVTGDTLVYATYLTGAQGDTTPAALAADAADNLYIAGSTSASGLPSVSPLIPVMIGSPSGFLMKLPPGGDDLTFSTFVPGAGLRALALDPASDTLIASGSVALGRFPVATVPAPILAATGASGAAESYQVLLRLALDGASVRGSVLLAPGTQSTLAADGRGGVWVAGDLSEPLLPLPALAASGTAFAVHVTAQDTIDQTARFGGLPSDNLSFASLPLTLSAIAVDPSGDAVFAGAVEPTASASLLATQTYDLPLSAPTAVLPSSLADAALAPASCNGSLCVGSAAYLARLQTTVTAAAVTIGPDSLPLLRLLNLGSAAAADLQLTAQSASFSSDCPTTLLPGATCSALVTGGPGSLTVSSTNGGTQTIMIPALPAPASTVAFSPGELDFGIVTATGPPAQRTLTVTNLGGAPQTFTSAIDSASRTASPFTEVASDCPVSGSAQTKVLAPGASCQITLGFSADPSAAADGPVASAWRLGARAVQLTAHSQAAALSLSAPQLEFGTQFAGGLRLPRFLYLSNHSPDALAHRRVTLPAASPFTAADTCPLTLLPGSVCAIRFDYRAANSPSSDAITLTLDQGQSVLISGQTLTPLAAGASTVNPDLSVSSTAVTFPDSTVTSGVSSSTQTITVTNTGVSAFPLGIAVTGEFLEASSCGPTLAAGQTCAIVFSFAPAQPGMRSGVAALTAGAGTAPLLVTLSGLASPLLQSSQLSNGALDLGTSVVGVPAIQFVKVAQPLSSLSASATGPYLLALVEDSGFGPTMPPTSAFTPGITGAACHLCYLAIRFTPAAAGAQPGTLVLRTTATGAAYSLLLTGTGTAVAGLLLTPATQDFGTVALHSSSAPALFTATNLDPAQAVLTLAAPSLTGDFLLSPAATGGKACGGPLAYGASCFLSVVFAPSTTGSRAGSLSVTANASTATTALTGLASADPGLAFTPNALVFRNVPGASATRQSLTLTNTGAVPLTIATPASSSNAFVAASTCTALLPLETCTISVSFQPGASLVSGTLVVPVSTLVNGVLQGSSYAIPLSGTYTAGDASLQILPNRSDFGASPVGVQGLVRQFTINNLTAQDAALTLNLPRNFILTTAPCGTLPAGGSCSFSVAFLPLTNAASPGTLSATAVPVGGGPAMTGIAYLEGYGTGASTLTLTGGLIVNRVYSFGQVASGQAATQIFTLANRNAAGSAPITVRRVSSGPPFRATSTCGGALAPGQSCTVKVAYAPTNQVPAGTASPAVSTDAGVLTIESDALSSPDVINLAGIAGPLAVANPSPANLLATYTLSGSSLTFPPAAVGDMTPSQTVSVVNTGTATLHFSSFAALPDYAVQTDCGTLVPGGSCSFVVAAAPQTPGIHAGALEIRSDATVALEYLSLTGTGNAAALTLAPTSLDFGTVLLGASLPLPVQVTNATAGPVAFSSILVSGQAAGDYAVSGSCPAGGGLLAPGSSCTLQVTFAPAAVGVRTATLMIASSASTLPLSVALSGNTVQPLLTVSPQSLSFGSIVVGALANLPVTLTNTGTTAITGLTLATVGDFTVTIPCPSATLPGGSTCVAQVSFIPTASGGRSGGLTVTSSDPGSPVAVPLSGNGLPGGGFTLLVDGAVSSTHTTVSGTPASYQLALIPNGSFNGVVALTCTPVSPAPYATCSLLPSTLAVGNTQQPASATINTVTAIAAADLPARPGSSGSERPRSILLCSLIPGLFMLWRSRRTLRQRTPFLLAMFLLDLTLAIMGCGGSGADARIRYTPPGSYQYQVTASSTSGVIYTQTVTLNLNVTAR